MKVFPLILICFLIIIPAQDVNLKLEAGAPIPSTLIPKNPDFIVVPRYLPTIQIKLKDINYEVAYNQRENTIAYVFTSDEHFKTSDGYQVGTCLELTKEQLSSARTGITTGPQTEDGWRPIVGYYSWLITCNRDVDGPFFTVSRNEAFSKSDKIELIIDKFMK